MVPGHSQGLFISREPLTDAAVDGSTAQTVESHNLCTQLIHQFAVVADQYHCSGELRKAVFEDFQRRNVEIIGRFIEKKQIGRLQHELRDPHTGLLAAGQAADEYVQLFRLEKELLRPGGDVQTAVAIQDRVAVGAERLFQGRLWIESRPPLLKHHCPQALGSGNGAGVRVVLARENVQ